MSTWRLLADEPACTELALWIPNDDDDCCGEDTDITLVRASGDGVIFLPCVGWCENGVRLDNTHPEASRDGVVSPSSVNTPVGFLRLRSLCNVDEECSEACGVAEIGVATVTGLDGALAGLAGGSGSGATSNLRRDFKNCNGFGERNALLVGSERCGAVLLSDLSISGWAGGAVTSTTRCEDDARNSSLWKDEEASAESGGGASANAESQY